MTKHIFTGAIYALIITILGNVLIYWLGAQAGASYALIPGTAATEDVTLMMVVIASLVSAVGASLIAWLLFRFTHHAATIFLWLTLIVGLLSLIPVYQSAYQTSTLIALGLMHVLSATILGYFLAVWAGDGYEQVAVRA